MKPVFLTCLPCLGMALAATPAWAGSWSIGADFNGKCVSGSFTRPWAYSDENGIYQSAGSDNSKFGPGQTQNGSSSGKFILVLRWSPSSPEEKIPPRVTVRLQQTVQGNGGRKDMSAFPSPYNPASGTPGSVTLSTKVATPDGGTFSDTVHERLDGGYSYSSIAQNPPVLVVVSTQGAVAQPSGDYLVRYPLPSIEGTFKVTMGAYRVKNDSGTFDPYSDGAWGGVTASFNCGIDNREVYLTRGSAPKIKGAPGVTIDEKRDEWREVDSSGLWTTHGHTTYSYNWVGIGEQVNHQDFQANLGGTWTWKTDPNGTGDIPNVTWSWDPVGSDPADTYLSSRQMIRFGSPNKVGQDWMGKPTGTDSRTITYSATDKGDGAKATAKYTLTLHDAWEEDSTTGPIAITKNAQPITASIIHPESATGPQEYTFTVTQTKKLALKSGFSVELGKSVAELLKVVPKFSLDVTYEDSFAEAEALKYTLKPGEQTWVDIVENYDRYSVKGFSWNPSGFAGPADFDADVIPSNRKHYGYQLHLPPLKTGTVGNTGGGTTP